MAMSEHCPLGWAAERRPGLPPGALEGPPHRRQKGHFLTGWGTPPAPLRNQATVDRAWFSAMLLLMDFIKGDSRGQPDGFQESFLKRVSL